MTDNKCMDVNMTTCFYCGEANGIAIGKKLISCKNKWDTKKIFGGYQPCDKCQEKFDEGFLIIEGQETPMAEGQPEIQKGVYPTGNYWLIKNEAAEKIFTEEITKMNKVFVEKEMAEKLGLYNEKASD